MAGFPVPEQAMQRWKVRATAAMLAAMTLAMAGCAGGPVRRVSEPAASIQQLAVGPDGRWTVELRLQNFSNVAMRFDKVDLTLRAGTEEAGKLSATPALTVGPETADITTVTLAPTAGARIVVAGALADHRNLDYVLEGTLTAAAQDKKARDYEVRRASALSPVPGLPGTLR